MKVRMYNAIYDDTGVIKLSESGKIDFNSTQKVLSSEKCGDLLVDVMDLGQYTEERMFGIFLKPNGTIAGISEISKGDINYTVFSLRQFAKIAILLNSTACIMAHNHPSGSLDPSFEDMDATKRVKDGMWMLGIQLVDHFIVGGKEYTSMKAHGYFDD